MTGMGWAGLTVLLITGVLGLVWSWLVWRDPDRLRPGSVMYRVVNARWNNPLRNWIRKTPPDELSKGDIKVFAKGSMIGSLLLIVIALIDFAMNTAG
jgi:hypothetical protein